MSVPEVWMRWPGVDLRERPVMSAVAAEQESASARSVDRTWCKWVIVAMHVFNKRST